MLDEKGENDHHEREWNAHHGEAEMERVLDSFLALAVEALALNLARGLEHGHIESVPVKAAVKGNRLGMDGNVVCLAR